MFNTTTQHHGWISILLLCAFCGRDDPVTAQDKKSAESELQRWVKRVQDTSLNAKFRLNAVDDIEMLRVRGKEADVAVAVLRQLLKDQSVAIRVRAARALLDFNQSAETLLPTGVEALKDSNPDVRIDACYLLWALGRHAATAIDRIVEALEDDDVRVRSLAANVIGEIGPDFKQTSIPPLARLLEDADRSVRIAAAEALAKVDGPVERSMEVLVEAVRYSHADATTSDDSPWSEENETVEKIGQLRGDAGPAVATLNEGLKLGGTYRQSAAAKALSNIGPDAIAAIDGLAIALQNGEGKGIPFVRESWCASDDAAKALAIIGIEAVPILVAALSDADERVRANAADALGDIPAGANTSVSKLAELLADDDPAVRSCAAWSLGKLGRNSTGREAFEQNSSNIIQRLVAMLFDNAEWHSAPAGGGIGQSYSVPWHAVEAIARIQPAQQQLMAALKTAIEKDQSINFAVATTIASIGPEGSSLTKSLGKLLPEKKLCASAAFAIAAVDPEFDGLQQALESALVRTKKDWPDLDEDREVDPVAARGLGLLGPRAQSSIPRLKDAIQVAAESVFAGNSNDIIVCSLAILRIDPNDRSALQSLLDALTDTHAAFDRVVIGTVGKSIPQLISSQNNLRTGLIAGLNNRNLEVRLRSAAFLTEAKVAQSETVAALIKTARNAGFRSRGKAVDLLSQHGSVAKDAVDLLTGFFPDPDENHVGGEFYRRGGPPRTVSEKAVVALAAIGQDAVPALRNKLSDPNHLVRRAAATSLGLIGQHSSPAVVQLIELTADKSHLVRQASALALGRIGSTQQSVNQKLLSALRRCETDQRHAVRHASRTALALLK